MKQTEIFQLVGIENDKNYVIRILNHTKGNFRGTVRVNDIEDGIEAIVLKGKVKIIQGDNSELVYSRGERFRLNDGDVLYADNRESYNVRYWVDITSLK